MDYGDNLTTVHCVCSRSNSKMSHTSSRTHGHCDSYLRSSVRRLSWTLRVSPSLLRTALYLLMLVNICVVQAVNTAPDTPTFTPSGIKTFRGSSNGVDIKYYRHLSIDRPSRNLYVGAMNFLFQLDLSDISSNYKMSMNITNPTVQRNQMKCQRLQKSQDYECQNHIRVIIRREDGKLEVCGTAAYYPMKFTFDAFDISAQFMDGNVSESGRAFCSRDPKDTCTAIYIKSGNPDNHKAIYSGAIRDIPKSDPVIYRPDLSPNVGLLRTERQDKWLYKPKFVATFEVGEYVYFFLREIAMEYSNYGEVIYSRIARVCKNDRGGSSRVLDSRWTSYFKARLNCSLPGAYPFYFNEIHDVVQTNDSSFHGIFTTSESGMYGSAVCSFTISAINDAFSGQFLEQPSENSNWVRVMVSKVPLPRPGQCNDDSTQFPDVNLRFTETHPLMADAVRSHTAAPLFYQQEVMFNKIAVHRVNKYTVYFLANKDNGAIHKVASWQDNENRQRSKTVAIWDDLTGGKTVQQMLLYDEQLYLTTDDEVLQVPIKQCNSYAFCTQCVQDPHCGYDTAWNICTNRTGAADVVQDVEAEHPEKVCDRSCKHQPSNKHYIHVQGDAVHFHCSSRCEPSDNVEWYMDNSPLTVDFKKYFLTSENSLIVFNVTNVNHGIYECRSQGIVLTRHDLSVNECNDAESCWRQEFANWCQEFEAYKKEFSQWQCLKDKCTSSENCIPGGVVNECLAP